MRPLRRERRCRRTAGFSGWSKARRSGPSRRSTHIVDDVADLCPRMAVLANGRVQLEGKPSDLIEATRGKIWKKTISRTELEDYQSKFEVISTRLVAGNSVIHVLSDSQPRGFDAVEGGL